MLTTMNLPIYQHILDEFYKEKAEGAFARSRKRWMEEGEQNSSYFLDWKSNIKKSDWKAYD